jgi:hypothetical protein
VVWLSDTGNLKIQFDPTAARSNPTSSKHPQAASYKAVPQDQA